MGRFLAIVAGMALATTAPGAHAATVQDDTPRTAAATRSSNAAETIVLAQAQTRRAVSNAPQVFLFKGLADVFSGGMDTLAARLAQRGIRARVANHGAHAAFAEEVISNYRAGGRGPVVIIGHSLGADATVYMAERLNEAKVPVALIVGFGPTMSLQVPPNVARAVNFYQGSGHWRGRIVSGPGFRGQLANINLDGARDVNHFNIDKIDRLQSDTVNRVISAIGGARRPATTTQNATGEASASGVR